MNDVVNMSISSEFSVNLMNELSSDPTISPEQKRYLRSSPVKPPSLFCVKRWNNAKLKNVYNTFANMEDKERKRLLTDEVLVHTL
jgi:hypothetical protein